jgi:hypothetical protein
MIVILETRRSPLFEFNDKLICFIHHGRFVKFDLEINWYSNTILEI